MLNRKVKKTICTLLLLLTQLAVVHAAEFEAFKTALEKISDNQEKLEFTMQQQALAKDWPLEELGRFYHQKGLVLEANNQIEVAKQAYSESINTFVRFNQPNKYWVLSLHDRSYMDYLLTNDPKIYCADRHAAVEVANKTDDPISKVNALVFLAFCFQDGFEAFKQGLSALEEAARIAQKNDLAADATAMIHNATGNLYRTNQIDDKAYEYYQKAYDHWIQLDDIQDMFNMQHNMAGQSIKLGQWKNTEKHIKILFELTEKNPDFIDFKFFSYFNQARLVYAKHDYLEVIKVIEMALKLSDTTAEIDFVNQLKAFQIIAYFRSGQMKLAKALAADFFAMDIVIAREQELNAQVKLVNEFLAGDFKSSIMSFWQLFDENNQAKYNFIKNTVAVQSLTFDQTIGQFQEQALGRKLKISELELEKKTKQNKINQLTMLAAALLAMVFIVASFYLYKSRQFYLRSSRTDFLTGTHNRRRIFELGAKQLEHSKNKQQPFAVIVLDIDDFKNINDQFGHDLGDQALTQLVSKIEGLLSPGEYLGRMGGEEFLIIMPNASSEKALKQAEKIRHQIAKAALNQKGTAFDFTASFGVVADNTAELSFAQMVQRADTALYRAKSAGKNQVQSY